MVFRCVRNFPRNFYYIVCPFYSTQPRTVFQEEEEEEEDEEEAQRKKMRIL